MKRLLFLDFDGVLHSVFLRAEWVALDDLTTAWPSVERLALCDDGFRDAYE